MTMDKLILEKFFENHIDDAIKELSTFEDEELLSLIQNLSEKNIYKIFSRIESYRAIKILDLVEENYSAKILANIPAHSAVSIMRQFTKEKLNSILSALSEKQAVKFKTMLHFDEYTVGALMNPSVFTIIDDLVVKDALEDIKRFEGIIPPQIFVINRDNKLSGLISIQELIRANPKNELKTIIDTTVPKIYPQLNLKSIFNHPGWLKYYSLPVTDNMDNFLGAIKLETVRNFIEKKSAKELKQLSATGSALGELYRIGFSGLMRSAAEITTKLEK